MSDPIWAAIRINTSTKVIELVGLNDAPVKSTATLRSFPLHDVPRMKEELLLWFRSLEIPEHEHQHILTSLSEELEKYVE